MIIGNLHSKAETFSEKEQKELKELKKLIRELNFREIPKDLAKRIDSKITFLNNLQDSQKDYVKKVKTVKEEILKWLEKELKLVPKNHYINMWTALGMSAFGLSLGSAMFAITSNPAFIAVGLPIGLGIGSMYGASLDKKAEAEDRVLKYSV